MRTADLLPIADCGLRIYCRPRIADCRIYCRPRIADCGFIADWNRRYRPGSQSRNSPKSEIQLIRAGRLAGGRRVATAIIGRVTAHVLWQAHPFSSGRFSSAIAAWMAVRPRGGWTKSWTSEITRGQTASPSNSMSISTVRTRCRRTGKRCTGRIWKKRVR